MLEPYIKDQKITCLARSSTSNPNNGDLVLHCHENITKVEGKLRIHARNLISPRILMNPHSISIAQC